MEIINSILVSLASLASTKLLGAVVTALILLFVGKFLLGLVNKTLSKAHMDDTLQKFLNAAAKVVIYFVAIMIVASALGFEMTSLVALASVVSAAFALAASSMLSNLFGGLLLLMTKPFGVGDYVAVGGEEGTVLELGLLTTKINTVDNKRVTMPNSNISGATIVNYDLVIDKDECFARVSAYNDCTISYTLRAWCKSEDYWTVYFDLMEQVKKTFDQVGITMVYPILTVKMPKED